jgi:hypothetical protein
MAESKYGRYFIREPIEIGKFAPNMRFSSNFTDTNFTIRWHYVTGPWLMEEEPHAHDFDQFSCFIGGNPMDIRDFGALIELFLGEEKEKHVITATTIVYVPRGLVHGPLNFKRVDRPVMFINVPLTSRYAKKEIPR